MKYFFVFPLIFIIFMALALTAFSTQAYYANNDSEGNLSGLQLVQATGSTITSTATDLSGNQPTSVSTPVTTASLTLEPLPTVTLVFPDLPSSITPSATLATQEPEKGIPLSKISSNDPPAQRPNLIYLLTFFWLILVIFIVFIARKIFQLLFE